MRAFLSFFIMFLFVASDAVADRYVVTDTNTGIAMPVAQDNIGGVQPVFRADIQSTSTDWEAVSGLRLREYRLSFLNAKAAGSGWELYFLDGFPCYGYAQYVRTWLSSSDFKSASLRANCVRQPTEVRIAYRAAKRNEWQGRTDGILVCRVDNRLSIDLAKCEKRTWMEFEEEN